jgi:hypothetical protein
MDATTLELELPHQDEIELPVAAPPPPADSEVAARMDKIAWALVSKVGVMEEFADAVGRIIRSAVDYVIDAPSLYRYTLNELEPDEKTTIGKRIERLLRFQLDLPKGDKLDIKLAGEDVDIKTTMHKNWMFSKNNYDHINLLIAYSEKEATYRLGLAYVTAEDLGEPNRDQKRGMSKKPRENIRWLLTDQSYPPNFLAQLSPGTLDTIIRERTGMKRVMKLLETVNGMPIPRHVICSVANQKDPLRRIRSNGGARDILWQQNILVLSGAYECDRKIARAVLAKTLSDKGQILKDDETLTFLAGDSRLTLDIIEEYRLAHELPKR